MGPREIRLLRGDRSRAAFAQLLGVSPLTVLRWELPVDAKEARRPRAAMLERLERMKAGLDVGTVPPPTSSVRPAAPALDPDEEAILMPILTRLNTEAWPEAENDLATLLTSGELQTPAGRALAATGLAQAQMLGRFDLRAAFSGILPVLAQADRGELPRYVEGRANVIAAMVFGAPDARFFDAGRVNVHAARAEELLDPTVTDLRVRMAISKLSAALYVGPQLFARVFDTVKKAFDAASDPVSLTAIEEARSLAALVGGDPRGAARHAALALENAQRLGLHGVITVILGGRARRGMHDGMPPADILALTARIRAAADAGGVAPGDVMLRYLGLLALANLRLGDFGKVKEALAEGLVMAKRAGMPPYPQTGPAVRLYTLTRDVERLEQLADTIEKTDAGGLRRMAMGHAVYVRAFAAHAREDYKTAAELADEAWGVLPPPPANEYLCHDAHLLAIEARLFLGDRAGCARALQSYAAFLEQHPSVWYTTMKRRMEGYLLIQEGRADEGRQKLEAALATTVAAGDVVEAALGRAGLAAEAIAAGVAGAAELVARSDAELARLGVKARVPVSRAPRRAAGTTERAEPSLAERLVVAVERLSIRNVPPDFLRRELAQVVADLVPGHAAVIEELSRDQPDKGDRGHEWFDLAVSDAGRLRLGVEGPLEAEQRAVLRTLTAVAALGLSVPDRAQKRVEVDLDADPDERSDLPGFIAAAPATRRLRREIGQLSGSNATILITGQSGAGKEVVARAVHDLSARAGREYVAFNCASIPRDLFEGQLFGYKRGAFTGAAADHPGVIRAADKGTLFLDEIGELPLDVQPKLLRFLENGEVFPLGEQKPRRVDVRVLAATHRDLGKLVRDGAFREDLYYRLNVVPLRVPPLRERTEDIVALARLFVRRLTPEGSEPPTLAPDALAALVAHPWPGNVRELRNVMERTLAFGPAPAVLRAEHLRITSA
jgi:hypothetical protein